MHCLLGDRHSFLNGDKSARIRIAIESGVIATRYFQTKTMPLAKDLAGWPQVDVNFSNGKSVTIARLSLIAWLSLGSGSSWDMLSVNHGTWPLV